MRQDRPLPALQCTDAHSKVCFSLPSSLLTAFLSTFALADWTSELAISLLPYLNTAISDAGKRASLPTHPVDLSRFILCPPLHVSLHVYPSSHLVALVHLNSTARSLPRADSDRWGFYMRPRKPSPQPFPALELIIECPSSYRIDPMLLGV